MGVGSLFVVGDCCLWMGGGHLWWGVIVHGWGVVILRWVSSSVGGHSWSSVCGASSSVGGGCHLCVGCCHPWGSLSSIGGAWPSIDGESSSVGVGSSSSMGHCR